MASIKENNLELNYGWTYGESGWNSGMDENIVKLGFESRKRVNGILSSPPSSSPSNGDAYIVGTAPTGLFSGKFANIAIYDRGSWVFIVPKNQEVVFNTSNGCDYIYNNGWSLKLEEEVSPYIKVKDFNFSTGYTITDQRQCLLNIADNHYYQWNGTLPKVVSAGSTPSTAGGIGAGAWSDKTDLMLRGDLSKADGDSLTGYATYAQIRAYTGDKRSIRCGGRSNIYSGDGAHGKFYRDDIDTTSADNDGTILVDAAGRRWKRRISGEIHSHWFGLNKNTTGDVTTNVQNFFDSASGVPSAIFSAGTFTVTQKINSSASNTHIKASRGLTKITGSFGYVVFEVLASNNTIYEGITFENLYSELTHEDQYYSTVYSRNQNLNNISFLRCKITCPNCIGNGISVYLNGLTTDAFSCDGFYIEECEFYNIGRIGCTLMNRSEASNKTDLFKNVRYKNNKVTNMGITGPTYGFAISLDGYGSVFECDDNHLVDCLFTGIEVTKWAHGSVSNNKFACGPNNRIYRPFGIEGTDVEVHNNVCVTGARHQSYFSGAVNCKFSNNHLHQKADGTSVTVLLIHNTTGLSGSNNTYVQEYVTGRHCVLFSSSSSCANNKLSFDTYNLNTTSGYDCVRFDGENTIKNTLVECTYNPTAGTNATNQNSATKNIIKGGGTPTKPNALLYNSTSISDVDVALTLEQYSAEYLSISGTLTAGRVLTFPNVIKGLTFKNNTTQTLTVNTVAGSSPQIVAAGKVAQLFSDGVNMRRVTADI